jgi:hypothetical protein
MQNFDPTRYRLGGLCARGHEFEETGKSLRYLKSPSCVQCAIEYRRCRDAEKRAARIACRPVYPPGMKPCPACATLIPVELWRCGPCRKAWHRDHRSANKDRHREQALARHRKMRVERWHLSLWRGARSSSKSRKLLLAITPEDIKHRWNVQRGRCHWSGVDMLLDVDPGHLLRVSLDRVDAEDGYTPENIVLTALFVNIGRRNRSAQETVAALHAISSAMR